MKISYISEAVFKNPTQAKAARAKDASLSNVDKLASTVKNISNTAIKTEIDKIISESLSKTSAFPFSSLFAQPIGGNDSWALTKSTDNLVVTLINDEEQTIECIIDAGNMQDRYLNDEPVKCIVGVFDPRARGNSSDILSSNASSEEIIEALTARNIKMIKTKARKELSSKTLPASETYKRAALDKIIKYKFVIKNIFIGVIGSLRVKNMMNPSSSITIVQDDKVKQMLMSLITFVPRTNDACIKFKNSEFKAVDSGVVFNSSNIDNVAKDIVNTTMRAYVLQTLFNLDNEKEYIHQNDKLNKTNLLLKCKPAFKNINKELIAYLAKGKSITIKDIKYTFGKISYSVTNLKTKAETEEIDEKRVFNKGIKIVYSLSGDAEDSNIFATLGSGYITAWAVENNSYFLLNNLKPTNPIEELKFVEGSFWNQKNLEYLCNAKTVADITNVVTDVYYRSKQKLVINGISFNSSYYKSTDISKLTSGKCQDINEEELRRVIGELNYILNIAKQIKGTKK